MLKIGVADPQREPKMRSLLVLALSLAIATPTAAQIAGRHDYGDVPRVDRLGTGDSRIPGPNVRRELDDILDRIEDARESGRISPRHARHLRHRVQALAERSRHYGRDGMSNAEAAEIELRTRALRDAATRPTVRRTGRGG